MAAQVLRSPDLLWGGLALLTGTAVTGAAIQTASAAAFRGGGRPESLSPIGTLACGAPYRRRSVFRGDGIRVGNQCL
jgi:hypothetical protein